MDSTVRPEKRNPTLGERGKGQSELDFGKDLGLMSEVIVTGRKVGAGRDFWSLLAHNEFVFRQFVHWAGESFQQWDSHGNVWLSKDQLRAQRIMGKDFISPWEVMKVLPNQLPYALEELLNLGTIPCSVATLKECRGTHVLVPGFSLALADLYQAFPEYVMPKTMHSTGKLYQLWSKRVSQQWFLIRKRCELESGGLAFAKQINLLSGDDVLPGLPELYYAALICKAVCNSSILPELVRCKDTLPNGERVCVITRNAWHVDIVVFADDFQMNCLGIASMKKRQTAS